MKKLILLLAVFAFVGFSTEMMAQATTTTTTTTTNEATATKMPLSSVNAPAQKGCCASKSASTCSKEGTGTKVSLTTQETTAPKATTATCAKESSSTSVSLTNQETATEKKACCTGEEKKACCADDASKAQTSNLQVAPKAEKISNKKAPAQKKLTHASERRK
jgi:hypothetical protein